MLEMDLSRALFSGTRAGRCVLFVCVGENQFAIVHGDDVVRRGSADCMTDGLREFMELIDRPVGPSLPIRPPVAAAATVRCA